MIEKPPDASRPFRCRYAPNPRVGGVGRTWACAPMQAKRLAAAAGSNICSSSRPPASGKSRALMFVALDKLKNQGLKQAIIVTVPENSHRVELQRRTAEPARASSPTGTWSRSWNLSNAPGGEGGSKVDAVGRFLASEATRRWSAPMPRSALPLEKYGVEAFDDRLIAVDEFHHVSSNEDNKPRRVHPPIHRTRTRCTSSR